jgi:hypothetical protein
MDQSKKTMRHFYCRDVLWETFEQMANDFDCSIDYLINEAMRYYARSKNYQSVAAGNQPQPSNPSVGMGGGSNGPSMNSSGAGVPSPRMPQPTRPQAVSQPPPVSQNSVPRRNQPPTPGYAGAGRPAAASPAPAPFAPPPVAPTPGPGPGGGPTLYLVYNGQRYPVTKDQFIIGRGSKTSDLAIKDGNISRKHAAVIRRNGTFYIKDLGSTNGIDYKGMRIDNKRIDEGDVFHLCDYELRFTYRPD